jgi:hypothetical protein
MFRKKIILLMLAVTLAGCASRTDQTETKTQPAGIRVSLPETNANEPAIAAGRDGSIFVAWVEHTEKKEANVMFQPLEPNGQRRGEPLRVNPRPNNATAWRGDQPTIKVGRDGAIFVGWTERVAVEKGAANNLYLSVSRDGGRTFDAPVKVNDDTVPASHGMHSLAVDDAGRVFFAWLDERYLASKKESTKLGEGFRFENAAFFHHTDKAAEPNAEVYFAASSDGGKTFSANKKIAGDVCPCCKTTLVTGADGKIYASWRQVLRGDFRHIAVASSADSGKSFSSPVIVSDDKWQINACPVSGSALALDAENNLTVAWFTAGEAGKRGLYLSESKDGGKTFAPRVLASESTVSGTPLLLEGEKKIVWADVEKLYTAKVEIDKLEVENKRELGEGSLPAAALSDGKIFLAYVKNDGESGSIWLSVLDK